LLLAPLLQPRQGSPHRFVTLSQLDRQVGAGVSLLAEKSPFAALRWARHQRAIARVLLGPDNATLELWYRDGGVIAVLPPAATPVPVPPESATRQTFVSPTPGAATRRAVVLEPFATELGL